MADELPRYRALARIFLKPAGWAGPRTVEADEEFAYAGIPNAGMLALNAPARAAKLAALDKNWRVNPYPAQVHRLARSLGYVGDDGAEARAYIENIEKEGTVS